MPDVHYLPPRGGASHALPDPFGQEWTDDPAKVTCPTCLAHLPAVEA